VGEASEIRQMRDIGKRWEDMASLWYARGQAHAKSKEDGVKTINIKERKLGEAHHYANLCVNMGACRPYVALYSPLLLR
jgi:hypothetical protein